MKTVLISIDLVSMLRRQFICSALLGLTFPFISRFSFASSNPDVIVIGAGSAGLAATNYLQQNGKTVICIEADNHIGGLVYTDNSIFGVPYDTGARWIEAAKNVTPAID